MRDRLGYPDRDETVFHVFFLLLARERCGISQPIVRGKLGFPDRFSPYEVSHFQTPSRPDPNRVGLAWVRKFRSGSDRDCYSLAG